MVKNAEINITLDKMKKIISTIIIVCLTFNFSIAKNWHDYFILVMDAHEFYQNEEFNLSGEKFTEAFHLFDGKEVVLDRYFASYVWTLAKEYDSAFAQLFEITKYPYYFDIDELETVPYFDSLKDDLRWNEFINLFKQNKILLESKMNMELVLTLNQVFENDQKYRGIYEKVGEEKGYKSTEAQSLAKKIKAIDKENLKIVQEILDKHGFLGVEEVGVLGNKALFIVIQHGSLETQEYYLPLLNQAAKDEKLEPSLVAMLKDRIAIENGNKQIYGTQIGTDPNTGKHYIFPMVDPEEVNFRRANVRLSPIENYLANWGLSWDIEEYKKEMKEFLELK